MKPHENGQQNAEEHCNKGKEEVLACDGPVVRREDPAGAQGQFCHIVADDLTGACDAAIQFRLRGARTRVALTSNPEPCEVLAFDTETRGISEPEMLVRIAALSHLRARVMFKKIDSLMRGNPAAEIKMALEAFGCDEAIVTPAFPAMGRRVIDGYLFADGLPDWVPLNVGALARNAGTDADLRRLVREGLSSARRILWAGSAGLASALAEELLGPPQEPEPRPVINGPVIFCIGSDHPVTLAQEALLKKDGHKIVRSVDAAKPAGAVLITGGDTAAVVCRALQVEAIQLEGEILTGLPWGRIVGGPFDRKVIATKSGAFGSPDALLRVAAFFAIVK